MAPEQETDLDTLFPGEENEAGRKALRAERDARASAERRVKLLEVVNQHPGAGLTEDDFEGLTPDKFEARATRIAALTASGAPAAPKPDPAQPETQQPSPTEDAFAR